jgi:DNA-binding transcriptional ArsR family regulator
MDTLSQTFAALADPTRRGIVARLAAGDATVSELAEPFDISGPAISRHLKVLEAAQLIERRIDARWRVCTLKRERLAEAQNWIGEVRQFWESGFDRLEALLQAQDERTNERQRKKE